MAKRIKKRVKRARVSRQSRTSKASRRPATNFHQPLTEVHVLGIAAGIIILIAGILWLLSNLLSWQLAAFSWFAFGDLGIINIACGLIILIVSATLKKNFLGTGLMLLVFSIIAVVIPPAGFVVGPILGLIAAVIALVKSSSPIYK